MKLILFKEDATNFNNNGIGILHDVISDEITEESNGEFELYLEYPDNGKWADEIKDHRIIRGKPSDRDDPHNFRIYEIRKSLDTGTIIVHATSKTNDLGGNLVQSVVGKGTPQQHMNRALSNLIEPTDITFQSDISTESEVNWVRRNPLNCIIGEQGSLVQIFGGEIKRTDRIIYLYSRRGRDTGMVVRQGRHIDGFDMDVNTKGLVTRILPYATFVPEVEEGQSYEEAEEVTIIGDIVDSPLVDNYPVRNIIPIDYSEDGIKTVEALNSRAASYFTTQNPDADKPNVTIDVNMVQLAESPEYEKFKQLETIGLTDTITVYVPKHKVDVELKVSRLTYSSIKEQTLSLTAGSTRSTFYDGVKGSYQNEVNNLQKYMQNVVHGVRNVIQMTADGKNRIFRGYTEPSQSVSQENDLWFKEVGGGEVEIWIFDGMNWQPHITAGMNEEVEGAVRDALQDAEEAKAEADRIHQEIQKALDEANLPTLSDLTRDLQTRAIEAENKALDAISNAQTAWDHAQEALNEAGAATTIAEGASNNAQSAVDAADSAMTRAQSAIDASNSTINRVDGLSDEVSGFEHTVDGFSQLINDYEGQVSQFVLDVDGFESLVTGYETELDEFGNTVASYTSEVSTFRNTINGFESTVTEVRNEFDNLEIGGRNLAFKTEDSQELTTRSVRLRYNINNEVLSKNVGNRTTLSFEAKFDSDKSFSVYIIELPSSYSVSSTTIQGGTTEWKKFTATIEIQPNALENTNAQFTLATTDYGAIRNLKVELGSVATDWTPAPEDMATSVQVSTLSNTVDGLKSEVVSYEQTVDGYSAQVSSFENTLSGLSSTVSSYGTEVSGFRNDVTTYENQVSTFTNTLNGLNNTVASYESQVDEFGQTVGTFTNQVSSFENTLDGLNNTVASFSDDVSGYENQVSQFSNTVNGFNATVESVEGQYDELAGEIPLGVGLADKTEILSGTEIFTDKADNSVVHVEIDGKSYQHTDETNLFLPTSDYEENQYNTTLRTWKFQLNPNTQYTASTNAEDRESLFDVFFDVYNTEASSSINGISENISKTITTDSTGLIQVTTRSTLGTSRFVAVGSILDKTHWVRVEEGNAVTPFRGYPAPTPDYPVEIHSLNDFDVVSDGNLINKNTITRGRYLNYLGNVTTDSAWFYTDYIDVSSHTNLITSGYTNLGNAPSVIYYDHNKSFIKGINNAGQSLAKNITIDNGIAFIRFSGMIRDLPTLAVRSTTGINQINLLLSEPLRSVGNVKDRLFRDSDGLWKVERNVGEYQADGTENWTNNISYSGGHRFDMSKDIGAPTTSDYISLINSHFIAGFTNEDDGVNKTWIVSMRPRVVHYGVSSTASIKSWMKGQYDAGKPVTWVYKLANPTIEILDQELQDNLNNLRSFQDSNYVYTIINDKTDISLNAAENLRPELHATFKGGGWYHRFKNTQDISQVRASLSIEAGKISTLVTETDELGTRMNSVVATANSNTARIADTEGNLSLLEQTVEGVRSLVVDVEGDLSTEITQLATSIGVVAADADRNTASIDIHAGQISTLVSSVNENETNISSLTATSSSLESTIQSVINTPESVISDFARLQQTANTFISVLGSNTSNITNNISQIVQTSGLIQSTVSGYVTEAIDNALNDWPDSLINSRTMNIHYMGPSSISLHSIGLIDGTEYILRLSIPTSEGDSLRVLNVSETSTHYVGTDSDGMYNYQITFTHKWDSGMPPGNPLRIVANDGSIISNVTFIGLYRTKDIDDYRGELLELTNQVTHLQSTVTQLSHSWSLRIKSGSDIVSEINATASSVRIAGKSIVLDGNTAVAGDFTVTNMMIASGISASKITTGTLNANNVTINNLNINKIVGNTANFVQTNFNSIYSSLSINARGLRINAGTWEMWLDNNGIDFTRQDKGALIGQVIAMTDLNTGLPSATGLSARSGYSTGLFSWDGSVHKASIRVQGSSGLTNMFAVNRIRFGYSRNYPDRYGYLEYEEGSGDLKLRTNNASGDKNISISAHGRVYVGSRNFSNTLIVDSNGSHMYSNLNMRGYSITNQSDGRTKKNIKDTEVNSLEVIRDLKFVGFDYIRTPSLADEDGSYPEDVSEGRKIGLIAQDSPYLAEYDKVSDEWSINTSKQIMHNSHAIQQLLTELEQAKRRIKELEGGHME